MATPNSATLRTISQTWSKGSPLCSRRRFGRRRDGAVGDKVFIKYRWFADPIAPAPNGFDHYFLSVFHLDPAGSGLVVGNDEWFDTIAAEPYIGVYPYNFSQPWCTSAP